MNEPRPVVPVVVFPGSNDDRDAQLALERLGADAPRVWHTDRELPAAPAAVVLPGGFSFGDYLRCGAIARFSPVLEAVTAFAADGGLVLGICNGFQVLTEAGLLPGALRPNASLSFVCRDVPLTVTRADTPFTARCTEGQTLTIPVKHGEGCWFADDELLSHLETTSQIAAPLRRGQQSERCDRRCRWGAQRERQCPRADAASRARRRRTARLDRRRPAPRLARRRRSLVARGRRLGAPEAEEAGELRRRP